MSSKPNLEWFAVETPLYLLKVVQSFFVDTDVSLEAAALWHLHVHRTDVILSVVMTFPPQRAKTTKRWTSRLKQTEVLQVKFFQKDFKPQKQICRVINYLNLSGCCEDAVIWVFQTFLFEALRLWADQQVEVCGQVASQQGFTGRNVEQEGERFHVESRLQHLRNAHKALSRFDSGSSWLKTFKFSPSVLHELHSL